MKVALPSLQSPAPYQEPPKDYGFVMDSNMRVASTSSLSAARGLRENLSKMMASTAGRPGPLNSSHSRASEPVETSLAQQDVEFAKMLENYKSSITPVPALAQRSQNLNVDSKTSEQEVRNNNHTMHYESEEDNELEDELEEEVEEEVKEEVEQPQLAALRHVASPARAPLPMPVPVPARVPEPVSAPLLSLPKHVSVPVTAPPSVAATQVAKETIQPTAHSSVSDLVPVVASVAGDSTKVTPAPTVAPTEPSFFVAKDSEVKKTSEVDQRSRLEAWERELQEREQKVLQYTNSLSRPLGAKMPPKAMSYDEVNEEKPESGGHHQDRVHRETSAATALRGSAEIHIHNHITPPPAVIPSVAPPTVPARSSYYESSTWQPSAYTPLKYGYSNTSDAAPSHTTRTEEVRPSVQTRVPIRSPYAFPPAPYSSLGSGRGTVDLSGLSIEKMRELTGHY